MAHRGNIISYIVGAGILAFLQAVNVEPGNHGDICSYSVVISGKLGKKSDCFRVKSNLTTSNYSHVLCVAVFLLNFDKLVTLISSIKSVSA